MLEESTIGTNLSRKATLLMAEVLAMANRVLPLSMAAKIQVSSSCSIIDNILTNSFTQAIPEVFCMATDYHHGENRIVGTSALSAIDSFNRNRARLEPNAPVKGFRQRCVLSSRYSTWRVTKFGHSQGKFCRGCSPSRSKTSGTSQAQDEHANGRQDLPILLARNPSNDYQRSHEVEF